MSSNDLDPLFYYISFYWRNGYFNTCSRLLPESILTNNKKKNYLDWKKGIKEETDVDEDYLFAQETQRLWIKRIMFGSVRNHWILESVQTQAFVSWRHKYHHLHQTFFIKYNIQSWFSKILPENCVLHQDYLGFYQDEPVVPASKKEIWFTRGTESIYFQLVIFNRLT